MMENEEKEIARERDEMTNIHNVVHNINLDMEVAAESMKNINNRDYSQVKVDCCSTDRMLGTLKHCVREYQQVDLLDMLGEKDDDGSILLDPEKCEIKFSPELGMSTIVPKRTKVEEVLDDMAKHLGPQDMGTLGQKKLVLNEDGLLTTVPMETPPKEDEEPKRPLVVNLFAGPGAGKSTGAAFLFAFLKLQKVNVELVTEFAKELAWEGDKEFMANNQPYITGQQIRRMNRLIGKVDVIITDSPIELGSLYTEDQNLKNLCISEGSKWNRRIDFFIRRVKPYNPSGRNQTFEEAQELDRQIRNIQPLVNMVDITGDMEGYCNALTVILKHLGFDLTSLQTLQHHGDYSDIIFNFYKNRG